MTLQAPCRALWRVTFAAMLVVITGLAALHWWRLGGPAFPLDDAYIVLFNVRALVEGAPNFPAELPLTGATSLLHTLLTAPFAALLGPETGLWVLCWLGVAVAASGALTLGRTVGLSPGWSAALTIAALSMGRAPIVLINGLETSWAMAALLWICVCFARDPVSRIGAFLCGILPFIRPELGLFSLILMLGAAKNLRSRRRDMLLAAALCIGPALALLAVQWTLSGSPLPRTGEAKRLFFGIAALDFAPRIAVFLRDLGRFLPTMGLLWVGALLVRGDAPRRVYGAAVLLAVVAAVFYGRIPFQNASRFMWFVMPPMVFALAVVAAGDGRRALLAKGAIAVSLALNLWSLASRVPADMRTTADARTAQYAQGTWVRANLDPARTLLVHDVGFVSWGTDQRLVDFVGLKTPGSIAVHRRLTGVQGIAALPEALDEILRGAEACAMLVLRDWNRWKRFAVGLRERGWTAQQISGEEMPRYVAFRVTPPEGPLPGCID
ncbi:MAG: hypothetical protein ACJAVR_001228 [Paracoccaceae bacterium]|jgi:hypothetical protein